MASDSMPLRIYSIGTLSKACPMSRKTAVQLPSSSAFRATEYTLFTFSVVEWFCRKPRSGISFLQVIIGQSLFNNNVSIIGNKIIGLQDLGNLACFPGFKIMWISATFHRLGDVYVLNIALKYMLRIWMQHRQFPSVPLEWLSRTQQTFLVFDLGLS